MLQMVESVKSDPNERFCHQNICFEGGGPGFRQQLNNFSNQFFKYTPSKTGRCSKLVGKYNIEWLNFFFHRSLYVYHNIYNTYYNIYYVLYNIATYEQPYIAHLVSLDDKHKIKCGEPPYPVAAIKREKKVIVCAEQVMAVGDHDFTKFGIIPSVSLVVCTPLRRARTYYVVFSSLFLIRIYLLINFYLRLTYPRLLKTVFIVDRSILDSKSQPWKPLQP